jgi:hypothetical protein
MFYGLTNNPVLFLSPLTFNLVEVNDMILEECS